MPQKVIIPDTSALIHDPGAIESFGDNTVVIGIWVIEELDRNKTRPNGKGVAAREVSRNLARYHERGDLSKGVPTDAGGTLILDYGGLSRKKMPVKLEDTYDNRIIAIAYYWHEKERVGAKRRVVLVSKDSNMRLKAAACGIEAEDYTTDKKIHSISELYTGKACIELTEDPMDVRSLFYRDAHTVNADYILGASDVETLSLLPNICCTIVAPQGECHAIYKPEERLFRHVTLKNGHDRKKGFVVPKNIEQAFTYSLLTDPSIELVSLVGQAGTGKTLMALLAANDALSKRTYNQITVYRPNIPLGRDLGFLPGDLEEKFSPWGRPIYDNLTLILGGDEMHSELQDEAERSNGKHGMNGSQCVDQLIAGGLLEISPINFIRGRSLHGQFVIIDEAQNLTPHEIKTIITRAGRGTKMVLTGDPYQIDNPYLDATSNGLSYLVERFKGQQTFGHITMEKTERSALSELAARIL